MNDNGLVGIVLAGGQSSRMGEDKSAMMRFGTSMLEFSTNLLKQAGVNQVVVSGKNTGVSDLVSNAGPLGGIHSVVSQTINCRECIILPVDMPLLDVDSISHLIKLGRITHKPMHYSSSPMPLYLPMTAQVTQFFATFSMRIKRHKGPSFKELFAESGAKSIALTNNGLLTNTNTPKEWEQAMQHLRQQRRHYVS